MKEAKIEIGDTVTIISPLECYDSYSDWVARYAPECLPKFERYHGIDYGYRGKVITIAPHSVDDDKTLYLVEIGDHVYVMGEKGVERWPLYKESIT